MFRITSVVQFFALAISASLLVLLPAGQAHADAASGTCDTAAGYKLGSYKYTYYAKNWAGEKMWSITTRKRWCYNYNKKRIGSVYAPKPSVTVYSYFDNAWNYKGISSSDSYYSDKDHAGNHHPNYPRWSHVSWHKVKMQHCAIKVAFCTNDYVKIGIIAYYDGSKRLILDD